MAVTSTLRDKDEYSTKGLKDFLLKHMPMKDRFISNCGMRGFDPSIPITIPQADAYRYAGFIGTISELYIDLIIARFLNMPNAVDLFYI